MRFRSLARYAALLATAAIPFLALCACSLPGRILTPSALPPTNAAGKDRQEKPPDTVHPVDQAFWPTNGWRSATPESQGMDSGLLAEALAQIYEQEHAIEGLVVVRNGYLITEAYVHPFMKSKRHGIHSCTKSVVSALIGIAIDQGYIRGIDQLILDFFPGRTVAHLDDRKRAMTLEHLLSMSTGLECRDSYLYRWRGLNQMRQSDDWVQHVLDLPMLEAPGTRFEYCNGASFLLSAVLQETTAKSALEFAQEHLFGPLGITDVEWPANPQGISIGWGGIHMQPVDMAKIGYLYLRQGRWGNKQIVSASWVDASTRKHIAATLQDGYGYQWWVTDEGIYMALGYAGQFIFVVPRVDLVVVFISDLEEADFYTPQELLEEYIIPAACSLKPLPENPEGLARLEAQVQALAEPKGR